VLLSCVYLGVTLHTAESFPLWLDVRRGMELAVDAQGAAPPAEVVRRFIASLPSPDDVINAQLDGRSRDAPAAADSLRHAVDSVLRSVPGIDLSIKDVCLRRQHHWRGVVASPADKTVAPAARAARGAGAAAGAGASVGARGGTHVAAAVAAGAGAGTAGVAGAGIAVAGSAVGSGVPPGGDIALAPTVRKRDGVTASTTGNGTAHAGGGGGTAVKPRRRQWCAAFHALPPVDAVQRRDKLLHRHVHAAVRLARATLGSCSETEWCRRVCGALAPIALEISQLPRWLADMQQHEHAGTRVAVLLATLAHGVTACCGVVVDPGARAVAEQELWARLTAIARLEPTARVSLRDVHAAMALRLHATPQ
jgi:hypothetical protein